MLAHEIPGEQKHTNGIENLCHLSALRRLQIQTPGWVLDFLLSWIGPKQEIPGGGGGGG